MRKTGEERLYPDSFPLRHRRYPSDVVGSFLGEGECVCGFYVHCHHAKSMSELTVFSGHWETWRLSGPLCVCPLIFGPALSSPRLSLPTSRDLPVSSLSHEREFTLFAGDRVSNSPPTPIPLHPISTYLSLLRPPLRVSSVY